jgi:hypothetical protein
MRIVEVLPSAFATRRANRAGRAGKSVAGPLKTVQILYQPPPAFEKKIGLALAGAIERSPAEPVLSLPKETAG